MIDTILNLGSKIISLIDKSIEDKDLKKKLQSEISREILKSQSELLQAQSQIITTEAKSESFLTRSWRPIVMLTFTFLLVLDWLGLTTQNLSPELKQSLYELIKIGLGGYVIGRSVEKTIPALKPFFERR